ncbi:MAG TPA: triose-phosphate isomerase [Vicinamibacterales bacterium]|nr:triose-phosphate isomerase [Vicinamibacterales bacterium]
MRKPLVAGNWKMNGSRSANAALVSAIRAGMSRCSEVEVVLCPPAAYLESVGAAIAGSAVSLGGQNLCDQEKPGAFTGEIYGGMLADLGCRYVIVGHSERRALYGEDDARVAQKFRVAQAHRLTPILCVGETLSERETGQTEDVLSRQLHAVLDLCGISSFTDAVIAYEPVWAIGTGRTASPEQAQQAHAFLRGTLAKRDARIAAPTRILYGGSVKGDNATELFAGADVDGGLIGGASLKAEEFLTICAAAQAQVR